MDREKIEVWLVDELRDKRFPQDDSRFDTMTRAEILTVVAERNLNRAGNEERFVVKVNGEYV